MPISNQITYKSRFGEKRTVKTVKVAMKQVKAKVTTKKK